MKIKSTPWQKVKRQFTRIFSKDTTEGVLMLIAVASALIWANSPWSESYHHLWEKELYIGLGEQSFRQNLHHFINDGLMAIFFFLVGLEIKREILLGELSSWRKALLPIICAVGGMICPALIYFAFNATGEASGAWGVPMATDIAFVLVILAVLGSRVPVALKVFVTALAIVDDLGAVLVIAFFYTDEIIWNSLFIALGCFGFLLAANRLGVREPWFYGLFGISGVWLGFLQSGVHATLAGVLIAMAIPINALLAEDRFSKKLSRLGRRFDESDSPDHQLMSLNQLEIINDLSITRKAIVPPLQRIEHALSPFVNYFIIPIFAFANAGVFIGEDFGAIFSNSVSIGIVVGLVIGKLIGIVGTARIATWLGWVNLPKNTNWTQMIGAGILAGVGFTMSLFIAELALPSEDLLGAAKLGILLASTIAVVIGSSFFFFQSKPEQTKKKRHQVESQETNTPKTQAVLTTE